MVLEALDVEQGGRLHSTHELHRMLTSYVYPGKHISLVDFQEWLVWAEAAGAIRFVGIRWGLGGIAKANLDWFRVRMWRKYWRMKPKTKLRKAHLLCRLAHPNQTPVRSSKRIRPVVPPASRSRTSSRRGCARDGAEGHSQDVGCPLILHHGMECCTRRGSCASLAERVPKWRPRGGMGGHGPGNSSPISSSAGLAPLVC